MKSILFGLVLILATALVFGADHTRGAPARPIKYEPRDELAVAITGVKDFHHLEGYVRSKKKRQVRIVLGNLLPYAKWPKELSKEQAEMKKNGLKFLKDTLVGQKMIFWGLDQADLLHGDLTNWDIGQVGTEGPFHYDSNKPSGTLGWFTVHVNALLLERGCTVYAPDPAALNFPLTSRELDRAKFFAKAENYAIKNKAGLWKLGKDGEFGTKLKKLTREKDVK